MDKIWYRNPSKSEVIGCCGGDEKNQMITQNRQKSNAIFNTIYMNRTAILAIIIYIHFHFTFKIKEM